MVKNLPTKIKTLKYQKIQYAGVIFFGAFQVILSNGMASPVFNCGPKNGQLVQSFNVPNYSLVKRINGTKNHDDYWIFCLTFSKKNGTEIDKVETNAGVPYGSEFVIGDSEEIIGIYGNKDDEIFFGLGFIVWTPPKL